jgi:hypothetical protein
VFPIRFIMRAVVIVAPFVAAGFAWFMAIVPMTVQSNVLQAASYTDGYAGLATSDSQWSGTLRQIVGFLIIACLALIIVSIVYATRLLKRYRRNQSTLNATITSA